MAQKRKRGRPFKKWRLGTAQVNARCSEVVVEVFREFCRRRGVSFRHGMEAAFQEWCGVEIKPEKLLASKRTKALEEIL